MFSIMAVAAPEPGSLALLGSGVLGLLALTLRRNSGTAPTIG
jgi:hypothetical protein